MILKNTFILNLKVLFINMYTYLLMGDFKTLRDQAQEIGDLSDSAIRRTGSFFLLTNLDS